MVKSHKGNRRLNRLARAERRIAKDLNSLKYRQRRKEGRYPKKSDRGANVEYLLDTELEMDNINVDD